MQKGRMQEQKGVAQRCRGRWKRPVSILMPLTSSFSVYIRLNLSYELSGDTVGLHSSPSFLCLDCFLEDEQHSPPSFISRCR